MKNFTLIIIVVCVVAIIGKRSAALRSRTAAPISGAVVPISGVSAANSRPVQSDLLQMVQTTRGKILLHFWQPNCPPCEFMEPIISATQLEYPKFKMLHINTRLPESGPIHHKYEIRYTPTFVLVEDGCVLARKEGTFENLEAFVSFLQPSSNDRNQEEYHVQVELPLAISFSAASFYQRNLRWPASVADIENEAAWSKLKQDVSGYDSIKFKEKADGNLSVIVTKGKASNTINVARPTARENPHGSNL